MELLGPLLIGLGIFEFFLFEVAKGNGYKAYLANLPLSNVKPGGITIINPDGTGSTVTTLTAAQQASDDALANSAYTDLNSFLDALTGLNSTLWATISNLADGDLAEINNYYNAQYQSKTGVSFFQAVSNAYNNRPTLYSTGSDQLATIIPRLTNMGAT